MKEFKTEEMKESIFPIYDNLDHQFVVGNLQAYRTNFMGKLNYRLETDLGLVGCTLEVPTKRIISYRETTLLDVVLQRSGTGECVYKTVVDWRKMEENDESIGKEMLSLYTETNEKIQHQNQ